MVPRAELLKVQFEMAKMVFDMAVGDLTQEDASARVPGANINTIGAIYAHAVHGLDHMLSAVTGAQQLLLNEGDWMDKTGITSASIIQAPEWGEREYKLAGLKEYSEALFGRIFAFLEGVTDAQLDAEVPSPIGTGPSPVTRVITGFGLMHVAQHTGEIAALKGVQGRKGLPF